MVQIYDKCFFYGNYVYKFMYINFFFIFYRLNNITKMTELNVVVRILYISL